MDQGLGGMQAVCGLSEIIFKIGHICACMCIFGPKEIMNHCCQGTRRVAINNKSF